MKMIVAHGKQRQIGKENSIPWKNKEDLEFFKQETMGSVLIMGRKTLESLPKKLPGRKHVVLTTNKDYQNDKADKIVFSVEEAIKESLLYNRPICVIGGAKIYEQFLDKVSVLVVSEIDYNGEADVFFPEYVRFYDLWAEDKKDTFTVKYYKRKLFDARKNIQKDDRKVTDPFHMLEYKKELSKKEQENLNLGVGMILDTETTGFNHETEKVIELGYLLFYYNKETLEPVYPFKNYSGLQDPKQKLDDKIIEVTGLIDPMLKNKKIDWPQFDQDLNRCDVVIAHSASFDRGHIENYSKVSKHKKWLCSMNDIPWQSEFGHEKVSLRDLCEDNSFYIKNAHRALNDVEATYHLLCQKTTYANFTYMEVLILKSRVVEYLVVAPNTDYSTKKFFNDNQFRWFNEHKTWYKTFLKKEEAQQVLQEMNEKVYENINFAGMITLKAENRYKKFESLIKEDRIHGWKIKDYIEHFKYSKPLQIVLNETTKEMSKIIKSRGYTYIQPKGIWYMYVTEEESEQEKDWARKNIYKGIFKGLINKNKAFKEGIFNEDK